MTRQTSGAVVLRRVLTLTLAVLIGSCLMLGTAANAAEDEPELSSAAAAIVVDQAGNVLFSLNEYEEMPMASITKVMTAMVALDSGIDLDTVCSITEYDFQWDAQVAGYVEGDTPTLDELLQVMLVYSGNDAAYNVGVNVAGSEEAMVELMNQKAQELGMTHTHFANTHGLEDDGHYSCVADLVTMGQYALENYPYIAQTVIKGSAIAHCNGAELVLSSTDSLVGSYSGMRGIKTGAVESGYGFLGACERQDVQLYTCVLGCDSSSERFSDTTAMLDWAFDTYNSLEPASTSWVVGLRTSSYSFRLKSVISPVNEAAGLWWPGGGSLSYTTSTVSPNSLVSAGDLVGDVSWSQGDRRLGTIYLAARDYAVDVSSWPIFSLPLFYDVSTLGTTPVAEVVA